MDLSTHAGYAQLEKVGGDKPLLIQHGTIDLGKRPRDFGPYPKSYLLAAQELVQRVYDEVYAPFLPDVIVTEETNPGRNRYSQKILEFIHYRFVETFDGLCSYPIVYLDTGTWRSSVGLQMSKEQRKANAKLSREKSKAKEKGAKLDKKALGLGGRITKKHLAVALANQLYGLKLKLKDNNAADAILLGIAHCNGASPCTGV